MTKLFVAIALLVSFFFFARGIWFFFDNKILWCIIDIFFSMSIFSNQYAQARKRLEMAKLEGVYRATIDDLTRITKSLAMIEALDRSIVLDPKNQNEEKSLSNSQQS